MHPYQLQRYSGPQSKHRCPQCQNRRKTFSLYIKTETNEPLASHVGKCDREVKCGYHFTPKQWLAESGLPVVSYQLPVIHQKPKTDNRQLKTHTIPTQIFKQSLRNYHQNNLTEYLKLRFTDEVVCGLIERYLIGTSKHWYGATVFWQIDITGQIRAGKIMLYNVTNAKRIKLPFSHITWVHKLLPVTGCELPVNPHATQNTRHPTDFKLVQCFFGEHLLQGNTLPVAIVESEKTALISSIYLPHFIWLAAGSLNNLTCEKCAVLKDRMVYLYPDLGAYKAWQDKARELAQIASFTVFGGLETLATDSHRADGLDIADYLMVLWPL